MDVAGHDIRTLDLAWLHMHTAVVAQEPVLFAGTVADNIRFACSRHVTSDEVTRAARLAHAHDFISTFQDGYETLVGQKGVRLSGGEKQRISIARALLTDPRILVLDEATSALDAESERLVQDALDVVMRGRTTLVIAHRLSTIVNADKIVVMAGGRVQQQGSHRDLMKQGGAYKELVAIQVEAQRQQVLGVDMDRRDSSHSIDTLSDKSCPPESESSQGLIRRRPVPLEDDDRAEHQAKSSPVA
mmetsp:Transcript_51346/g.120489  ORF Transcript_51346/g.120489 Transcript_51346/m.120489 type:complete len:245 (-) Transcript_51346:143-877(-)